MIKPAVTWNITPAEAERLDGAAILQAPPLPADVGEWMTCLGCYAVREPSEALIGCACDQGEALGPDRRREWVLSSHPDAHHDGQPVGPFPVTVELVVGERCRRCGTLVPVGAPQDANGCSASHGGQRTPPCSRVPEVVATLTLHDGHPSDECPTGGRLHGPICTEQDSDAWHYSIDRGACQRHAIASAQDGQRQVVVEAEHTCSDDAWHVAQIEHGWGSDGQGSGTWTWVACHCLSFGCEARALIREDAVLAVLLQREPDRERDGTLELAARAWQRSFDRRPFPGVHVAVSARTDIPAVTFTARTYAANKELVETEVVPASALQDGVPSARLQTIEEGVVQTLMARSVQALRQSRYATNDGQ